MVPPSETGRYATDQAIRLLERLAFEMAATRRSHNPEAVHDLRVAIRRFAQALVVFKSCFGRKELKKMRRDLKDLMAAAGKVRDCDVALKFISGLRTEDVHGLETEVVGRRNAAEGALQAEVSRGLARKWSSKWRLMLEADHAGSETGHQGIEQLAASELPRMARSFFRSGDRAASAKASNEEVHRFRIAAKKFRYSVELFAQLYGSSADRWLERIARVQALLGAANDCRAVKAMVSQIGGYRRFEAALERRQRRKMAKFRQLWLDEFAQPTTVRQWLRDLRLPPRKPATGTRPPVLAARSAAGT